MGLYKNIVEVVKCCGIKISNLIKMIILGEMEMSSTALVNGVSLTSAATSLDNVSSTSSTDIEALEAKKSKNNKKSSRPLHKRRHGPRRRGA